MTTTERNDVSNLLCAKCGGPMPDLPDDLAGMLRSGVAVSLAHDVCPNETPPAPEGRYFEVRCAIVEVTEVEGVPHGDELASFVTGVRAADLEAAMRPLANALGERWLGVEKHARIADPRA